MPSKRHDLAKLIAASPSSKSKRLAQEIAAYLLETNQVSQLESLMRDVMTYRENAGQIEADVYSAHPISPEVLAEVRALIKHIKPQAKTVSTQTIPDESVIGGLKVRLAHEQLDMTVRAQLDTFKRLTAEGVN